MKVTMKKIISSTSHYRASTRPGFTFIELLFAIVVMGTMFALALVVFVGMLRFYVFAGSVRTNQENARNVLDTISRDVRFGQLIVPLDLNSSSTLCVYKKADRTVVKYEKLSSSNVINKSTSAATYDSAPADCATTTVTNFGTAQSVFNTNAKAAAFEVIKVGGAGTTAYTGVLSVTIKLQVITGTPVTGTNTCATKDIYCNSLTLNTAVQFRSGDIAQISAEPAPTPTPTPSNPIGASYDSKWSISSNPFGIAYDANNSLVYVVNQANSRIDKYVSNGIFISTIVTGLSTPRGLAVDSAGNVYVANAAGNNIKKYNGSGTLLSTIGTTGSGDGQLNAPSGVFVESGNIYVADANNRRVQKFNSSGVYQMKFGSSGTGDGQFSAATGPYGVVVDVSGNIFVVDPGGNSLQKFTSSGTFITKVTAGLNSPNNLAIDSLGNIYVANAGSNKVTIYNNTLTTTLATIGSSGAGDGQFNGVVGIAIDPAGSFWATDFNNNRVQKFKINY